MVLAVIILSAAGYLSYRNLSAIVSSIKVDGKPELRLLTIRDISMDLEKAQNSIRIYTITNDTSDLKPYYSIISKIDEKVSRLRFECKNDPVLLLQTDTISKLIEENLVIWNELLYLNNNQKVVNYLKKLSDRLNSGPDEILQTEKGILKRVFKRNSNSDLNEGELKTDLQQIELQDRITKEKMMAREAKLASTSSEIKEKFYDLIAKIENEISVLIQEKASSANLLATKTYIWLATFSISGTLLAILVMFIIVRYVRKTQAYQVALQNSKAEAEKLAKTKELFMANMSHEIRTPVTAISGFTEQLLHEPAEENTTRILKIIKSSSDHLANIINDILDFSKLQNGKLKLEKVHFSISKILEDLSQLFECQALRDNTVLSYAISPETPLVLLGDPYRLKQIMINLVSNSVKFTRNGKVNIIVKATRIQAKSVILVIEVIDTGIGIDKEKLTAIFEDFTQEEMNTTRNYGGTGLGLSIVKKLVELHAGTIECESRKNHGTRMTCNIPYEIGDEKLIRNEPDKILYIPEEIKNLKVLIVDDEEYNRLLFKTILSRWQVSYSEASSGMEALEILKTEQFDLIFMDIRMPGIDGSKAARFIRDEMNISEAAMPIICISAASSGDNLQQYIKSGMNAFLPKPFTEEMLLSTIVSVVNDYSPVISDIQEEPVKKEAESEGRLDLKNLYHISSGDKQFVKQMLVSFLDSTEKGLGEMQEAVSNKQWGKVSDLAHKLMPPCKHIGATNLYNSLRKAEDSAINNKDVTSVIKIAKECITEFELVRTELQQHITTISQTV